jgi:hypothetical protein
VNHPPCAWWHHPEQLQPLEAVRITLQHLKQGTPVPPAAASVIAKALRLYLDGQTDITANLGLRPRRGGRYEAPLVLERRQARDEGIRHLYALQDGTKTARAEKVAELLRAPPEAGRVTEADMFAYLLTLHRDHGAELPTSARQVLRVIDGDTDAARKA